MYSGAKGSILIDTGPIVALLDRDDRYHSLCVEIYKKDIKEPLLTTWPVLTEVFYLLGFSYVLQDALWEFIQRGALKIYEIDFKLMNRCRTLMKKYRDLPMDLADATLVAVAEAEGIDTIFTLDHKDFNVYRTSKKKTFRLLPESLK